ncbi:MAG: type II toxin-antitoxin system RelE/ParE family toxin [Planctomycetota bacterium]|nr:type II toxin-antitoxin system RelE/ParE family toxin [Planctomycetota bacterium]
MRIDFHPEATLELEESADWYAEQSQVAARGFALSVDRALKRISSDPERYPKVDQVHRSCNLARYPFQIIFRRNESLITVIAIAHAKRRPGYWRNRT